MATVLNIQEFLEKAEKTPIIDVRTPAEFEHGHIPNAFNIPIFSNEERAIVGTLYKQVSREAAMLKALEIVGPNLRHFAEEIKKINPGKEILVHCWRGGMRSNSMAWLFETVGYKAFTLYGGYKSFRRYVLSYLSNPFKFIVVGGLTGTGKTEILQKLSEYKYQVLDLEKLANHKGSAFGGLGQPPQPTSEYFENLMFDKLRTYNKDKPILTENESHSVGKVFIPNSLFKQITNAPTLHLELDKNIRIKRLVNEYAGFPAPKLKEAILKIKKRLGGLNTKRCMEAIDEGNFDIVADLTLFYYDKAYYSCVSEKDQAKVSYIKLEHDDAEINASIVNDYIKEKLNGNTQINTI